MNSRTAAPLRSLAEGNRLQRAYYRWAQPHYAKMAPELREQAEAIDRHLYSRQGLGTWVGVLGGLGGAAAGLYAAGMPWSGAVLVAFLGGGALLLGALAAWLRPEAVLRPRRHPWKLLATLLGALAGVGVGMLYGQYLKLGRVDPVALLELLQRKGAVLAPGVLAFLLSLMLLYWGVARARTLTLERQLERRRLEAERDAAAAQASEAQLRLLQAQIHPHFVFNTLAALQHWVDKADPRAGPLLRELSAYLRSATDMLGRPLVPLAEELDSVRHYLAIMKARWGERLHYQTELERDLQAQTLPPGLLLTLVENAVEHGIAHRLDGGTLWLRLYRDGAAAWCAEVEDEGVGLAPGWQPGVGLSNLRQRLQHHFGRTATLELQPRAEGGCRARLHIPLHPAQA